MLGGSHLSRPEKTYLEILVDLLPRPIMAVFLGDGISHANEDVGQIILLLEPELLGNAAVDGLGSNCLGFVQMLAGVVHGCLHGLNLCGDSSNLMLPSLNNLFGLHVITCTFVDAVVELKATVCNGIVLGNVSQDLVEKLKLVVSLVIRERAVSLQRFFSIFVCLHPGLLLVLVDAEFSSLFSVHGTFLVSRSG